ncbi:MAG: hypothetical protein IJP71_01535 [Lachnospiraceae bacterium]|nr:hypothetical protein [Lachnospiraceae bacterium]
MHIDDFVKEHKKKKYIDFMLSIGLNCKPAINIMSNGFRFFSSPLDFVEVRTIESVLHLFESKFDSFFSNYKIDFSKKTATGCYWIDDLTNEIYTIHFMKKGMPILESYRKFKEAMNLRAKRLDDRLKKVSKIVIVSQRPESKEELTWFLNEFSNLYPNLCIDFINMRNDMKMSFDEIKVINVLDDGKLSYTEYTFNDTRKCLIVPEGNIEMWSKILLQYENDNLMHLKKEWQILGDSNKQMLLYGTDRKVERIANWLSNIGINNVSVVKRIDDINDKTDLCIILCIVDKKAVDKGNVDYLKNILSDRGYKNILVCDDYLRVK